MIQQEKQSCPRIHFWTKTWSCFLFSCLVVSKPARRCCTGCTSKGWHGGSPFMRRRLIPDEACDFCFGIGSPLWKETTLLAGFWKHASLCRNPTWNADTSCGKGVFSPSLWKHAVLLMLTLTSCIVRLQKLSVWPALQSCLSPAWMCVFFIFIWTVQ